MQARTQNVSNISQTSQNIDQNKLRSNSRVKNSSVDFRNNWDDKYIKARRQHKHQRSKSRQFDSKMHELSPISPKEFKSTLRKNMNFADKENVSHNVNAQKLLEVEREKWMSKYGKLKKAMKAQVSELRTEIARREIKHQEEMLKLQQVPKPKAETPEMKFMMDQYRTEIETLKGQIEQLKAKLDRKDIEIDRLKEQKATQIAHNTQDSNNRITQLEMQNRQLEHELYKIRDEFEIEVKVMKSQHQKEIRALQDSSQSIIEEIEREKNEVINHKDAQICSLNLEMQLIKV